MIKQMINTKHLDELLDEIAKLPITHSEDKKENFNVFSVLGVETKEVIICRFLGELLNPKGCHQLKGLPLELFADMVLQLPNYGADMAETAKVELEATIDEQRRVDIVIHTQKKVIPIEVKIWAGDQESQLSDYYRFYKKKDLLFADRIYYLTPTGWSPSASSRGDLQVDQQIIRLSFSEHIRQWMKCLCDASAKNAHIHIILKQFIEVIDTMCEHTEELNALKNVLGLNNDFKYTDNLKAAIKLLSYKNEIEKTIMIKYLRKYLKIDDERFDLVDCGKEDEEAINDRHTLLKIICRKSKKPIAWICVHTNLYLVAQKVKSPSGDVWDKTSEADKSYYWQYISPDGIGHRFPLKQLPTLPDTIIDFDKCLYDIDIQNDD